MLVVFVDRSSDNFTDFFGADSYGEVMLFDKDLFSYMKSSVYSLIDNDYVIFSSNKSYYDESEYVFSSVEELFGFLEKTQQNQIAFFYLDTFIKLDFDKIPSDLTSENYYLCDMNGNFFGFLVNKNARAFFLDDCKKIILKKHDELLNLSCLQCVLIGKTLSNIKEYKALCKFILRSELCNDLPEIAQGIFSSGKIPSGDFVIIPPVYFGKDIQIESGSVIGPNSVIYDSSLISHNSIIDNSVLLSNCYISKDCFLENCICCSNVSVRRASSVLSGAVIGANAMLSEKSNVEKDACMFEFIVDGDDLSRILNKSNSTTKTDIDENVFEINDALFNIKCEKTNGKNLKILLKTVSYEVAEEIISHIHYD